jgi:hypothetical protein
MVGTNNMDAYTQNVSIKSTDDFVWSQWVVQKGWKGRKHTSWDVLLPTPCVCVSPPFQKPSYECKIFTVVKMKFIKWKIRTNMLHCNEYCESSVFVKQGMPVVWKTEHITMKMCCKSEIYRPYYKAGVGNHFDYWAMSQAQAGPTSHTSLSMQNRKC